MELQIQKIYNERYKSTVCNLIPSLFPKVTIPTSAPSYCVKYTHNLPTTAAAADESGLVYIIGITMGDCALTETFQAHHNSIFDINWTLDNSKLLTASGDHTGAVWDIEMQVPLVLAGHKGTVKCIKNSPLSSNLVCTASRDGLINLWDLRVPSEELQPALSIANKVNSRKKLTRGLTGFEFVNSGLVIVSAESSVSSLRFWDLRKLEGSIVKSKSKLVCLAEIDPRNQLENFSRSAEGSHGNSWVYFQEQTNSLIVSSLNNCVYVYQNLNNLEKEPVCLGGANSNFYVRSCMGPSGLVASGSTEGDLCIWEVDSASFPQKFSYGVSSDMNAVDWSEGSELFLATSNDNNSVVFWDFADVV